MQLWQALRATINMISVTPWVRTCFTRWRRTTVSPVSAAGRCDPSPSVSSITSDRRSSPSAVLWNACPASSHVVCKRWSKMVIQLQIKLWELHHLFADVTCFDIDRVEHTLLIPSFHPLLSQLEIQAPPGNTVGYVLQQWHPFLPKFTIQNEHREPVLKLQGPFCGWSCLPDVDFEVHQLKHLWLNAHRHQQLLTFTEKEWFLHHTSLNSLKALFRLANRDKTNYTLHKEHV